jgi:hypothetical protein
LAGFLGLLLASSLWNYCAIEHYLLPRVRPENSTVSYNGIANDCNHCGNAEGGRTCQRTVKTSQEGSNENQPL